MLSLVIQPGSLYSCVARGIEELFGCPRVVLLLLDADLHLFGPVATRGYPPDSVAALRFRSSDNLLTWLKVNETPLEVAPESGIFNFLSAGERETLLSLGIRQCVPLVAMSRIIGLLLLGPAAVAAPRLLAALASQAALALENALLYRQHSDRLRRMYRAERLATAGQLASGVAHEIRNPLTAIRSTIQLLAPEFQDDPVRRELIEGVLAEVDRINQIITRLLSFARPAEFHLQPVDLNALLEFSLSLVAAQARLHQVHIIRELGPLPPVPGDEAQLKQLFLNLFLNAIEAMPAGGQLRVEAASPETTAFVRVTIADTGCGMTEEVMERIFDPFFTTKPEGTGLGLPVSHAIVERHGGEIDLHSAPHQGATVTLRLPTR